jgi:hypothetical protein
MSLGLLRTLGLSMVLGLGGLGLTACGEDDAAEDVGEAIEETGEEMGEAVEEAGEEAEEATQQ